MTETEVVLAILFVLQTVRAEILSHHLYKASDRLERLARIILDATEGGDNGDD